MQCMQCIPFVRLHSSSVVIRVAHAVDDQVAGCNGVDTRISSSAFRPSFIDGMDSHCDIDTLSDRAGTPLALILELSQHVHA